ncbi:hypothetical protein FQA39_LY18805 [Lamprigera yunnana]|nr:hypothetical protein FQA39_LY18805 [Lamprigera yunnana]
MPQQQAEGAVREPAPGSTSWAERPGAMTGRQGTGQSGRRRRATAARCRCRTQPIAKHGANASRTRAAGHPRARPARRGHRPRTGRGPHAKPAKQPKPQLWRPATSHTPLARDEAANLTPQALAAAQQNLRQTTAARSEQVAHLQRDRCDEAEHAAPEAPRRAQERRDDAPTKTEACRPRCEEADIAVEQQGQHLLDAWQQHLDEAQQLRVPGRDDVLNGTGRLDQTPATATNPARTALHHAQQTASLQLAQRGAALQTERQALEQERAALHAERTRLQSGEDALPAAPAWRAPDARTGRAGAPLWTVEFAPALPADLQAGLEAALQASGLLDAWVTPDGQLYGADGAMLPHDTQWLDRPAHPKSLATWLRPAAPADTPAHPITANVLQRLLEGVACSDQDDPGAEAWISPGGRFRLGRLAGAWTNSLRPSSLATQRAPPPAHAAWPKSPSSCWNWSKHSSGCRPTSHSSIADQRRQAASDQAAARPGRAALRSATQAMGSGTNRCTQDALDLSLPPARNALHAIDQALLAFGDRLHALASAARTSHDALAEHPSSYREQLALADAEHAAEQLAEREHLAEDARIRLQTLRESVGAKVEDTATRIKDTGKASTANGVATQICITKRIAVQRGVFAALYGGCVFWPARHRSAARATRAAALDARAGRVAGADLLAGGHLPRLGGGQLPGCGRLARGGRHAANVQPGALAWHQRALGDEHHRHAGGHLAAPVFAQAAQKGSGRGCAHRQLVQRSAHFWARDGQAHQRSAPSAPPAGHPALAVAGAVAGAGDADHRHPAPAHPRHAIGQPGHAAFVPVVCAAVDDWHLVLAGVGLPGQVPPPGGPGDLKRCGPGGGGPPPRFCMTFLWFSAPDLALTQLVVEVVTTVLLLLGLRWLPKRDKTLKTASQSGALVTLRRWRDLLIAVLAGGGMAWLSFAMMSRPFPESTSTFFLERALPEGGGTNVVNVMLVDFRGFDTFGEIVVLGIVALTVYALLRRFRPAPEALDVPEQQRFLPADLHTDLLNPRAATDTAVGYLMVPAVLVRLLLPFAAVVSMYLFIRGHNEPGGGFVSGLVLSIGLLLQYIISGTHWVESHMRSTASLGLQVVAVALATAWAAGTLATPSSPAIPGTPACRWWVTSTSPAPCSLISACICWWSAPPC